MIRYFADHPRVRALNAASAAGIAASVYVEESENYGLDDLRSLKEKPNVPRILKAQAEEDSSDLMYVPGRTDMFTTRDRLHLFEAE